MVVVKDTVVIATRGFVANVCSARISVIAIDR
jgi:hypothetical protein